MTIDELLGMPAEEWNMHVSEQTGIPYDQLFDSLSLRQSLPYTEDKVTIHINRRYMDVLTPNKSGEPGEVDEHSEEQGAPQYDGVCLCGKVMLGVDFSGSMVDYWYINSCVVFNSDFINTVTNNSVSINTVYNLCDFSSSLSKHAIYQNCRFYDCVFDRALLESAQFNDCIFVGCQITDASMNNSKFISTGLLDCYLTSSQFRESSFILSSISTSKLTDCDMRYSKIIDATFIRTDVTGTDFSMGTVMHMTPIDVICDPIHAELFEQSLEDSQSIAFVDELLEKMQGNAGIDDEGDDAEVG